MRFLQEGCAPAFLFFDKQLPCRSFDPGRRWPLSLTPGMDREKRWHLVWLKSSARIKAHNTQSSKFLGLPVWTVFPGRAARIPYARQQSLVAERLFSDQGLLPCDANPRVGIQVAKRCLENLTQETNPYTLLESHERRNQSTR